MRDHLDWFGDVVSKISYNDWLSSWRFIWITSLLLVALVVPINTVI